MKRVRRTLLKSITILSLLLCLTALAFWFRSYHAADEIDIAKHDFSPCLELTSRVGRLTIRLRSQNPPYNLGSSRWKTVPVTDRYINNVRFMRSGEESFLGFTFDRDVSSYGYYTTRTITLEIPYYAATILSALLPIGIATRRLQKSLVRRNPDAPLRCSTCDYDLRATPNRCPECGTPASTTTLQSRP